MAAVFDDPVTRLVGLFDDSNRSGTRRDSSLQCRHVAYAALLRQGLRNCRGIFDRDDRDVTSVRPVGSAPGSFGRRPLGRRRGRSDSGRPNVGLGLALAAATMWPVRLLDQFDPVRLRHRIVAADIDLAGHQLSVRDRRVPRSAAATLRRRAREVQNARPKSLAAISCCRRSAKAAWARCGARATKCSPGPPPSSS